jgi:hypothetical protein
MPRESAYDLFPAEKRDLIRLINEFNGRRMVQLKVLDWRVS